MTSPRSIALSVGVQLVMPLRMPEPTWHFRPSQAAFEHFIADDLRHRFLGHAGLDRAQYFADDAVGEFADLLEDRDLGGGLDHAGIEVKVAARHEGRVRQAFAKADVVLRGHVIEFDRDASRSDTGLDQRVGEHVRRVLGELVVGADVREPRALPRQVLFDIDDDLRREAVARQDRNGATEAVADLARHQEAGRVGDVVLRECDQRIVARPLHGGAQLAEHFVFHRRHSLRLRLRRISTARPAICRPAQASPASARRAHSRPRQQRRKSRSARS